MQFIVVDLETTGLDPKTDAIIEIALMRIDETWKELERYESLINPGFAIKEDITYITGITNEDLVDAPVFSVIRTKIAEFLGTAPVIGHNVDFDVGFLREYGLDFSETLVIDTFKLAEILMLHEKSLNLTSIATSLKYEHIGAHRAMADVQATAFVFARFYEQLQGLDDMHQKTFQLIAMQTEEGNMLRFFATKVLGVESTPEDHLVSMIHSRLTHAPLPTRLISDAPESIPNFADVLAAAKHLEERPEQMKMLSLVHEAYTEGKKYLIEAPTGVGKTIAYMLPAILHSAKDGAQMFVSTNTRTLQDQIIEKDIPKLRDLLKDFGLADFSVQKLKGRTNYVSLLKAFEFIDKERFELVEAVFAIKVAFWLMQTKTGELDELSFYGQEYSLIEDINASDSRVLGSENPYKDDEFLTIAREGAKKANVVVVNHALLLTEFLEDELRGVLPKIDHLILDEVHNLESVATDTLKATSQLDDIDSILHEIDRLVKRHNKKEIADPFLFPEAKEQGEGMVLTASMFFEELDFYLDGKVKSSKNDGYGGGRATDILLDGEFFEHEIHGKLLKLHDSLQSRVAEFERMLFLAPEKLLRELDRPIARLDFLLTHLSRFLSVANTGTIRILSKRDGQSSKIITTPLAIGPLLAERLWKDRKSVIATSATLAVGGSFDYITGVLSLSGFDLHVLKTDFNYAKQALLYIPSELGDVRKENEKRAISEFVRDIILIFGGRTLMLFTAFTAIKEMTLAVAPAFKSKGIQLLTQGLSGGKHKMIGEFMRQSDRSVLFGTESFWEGVDFPGESLELLIIHKFPFAVPTDPIFMARSKLYNNAFRDYALPAMIIKLRQGIGRLIRTKTDKGVLVLLDKRIVSDWGGEVLASLPEGLPVKMASTKEFLPLLQASRPKFASK